jgi:pSer/pThr/pTyr-binding forkhead associated (FHA) protein
MSHVDWSAIGMEELEQRTVAVESLAGEPTIAAAPATCPVCGTANPPTETWCQECGFRLDAVPGEEPPPAPPTAVKLASQSDGREFPLHEGENLIGRAGEADVLIPHPSVSRRHAIIVVEGQSVAIEDVGSTNGTWVNSRALSPNQRVPVPPNAVIRFGEVSLTVAGAATPEAPAQEPPSGPALVASDGTVYPLPEGELVVGRRTGADVLIPDPYVSGRHALLIVHGNEIAVEDLGSTNGTIINGERLPPGERRELHPGDEIVFGRPILTLRLPPAEAQPPEA